MEEGSPLAVYTRRQAEALAFYQQVRSRLAEARRLPSGLKHTLVTRGEGGRLDISYKPVTITKFQPKERVY